MAQPTLLPPAFDGMAQDFPRNAMPKGKAWNLVDYIPSQLGAAVTERGGWAYAANSLTTAHASATYVKALCYAPFTGGDQLLAIDDGGHVLKLQSNGTVLDMGAQIIPLQNPYMHQQTVVIPSPDGTTAPQQYNGSGGGVLGANAPAGQYGCVFVNRSILASTTANPQRIYFSAAGDPSTWTTTGTSASYIDVGFSVIGIAALPNVILVFGKQRTARIRGTTPPPGSDMSVDDPIFNYGCLDARSIAVNGSLCAFANATGVFITNGAGTPEDLTASCGIKKYWRDTFASYTTSWTLAGGWFGNFYVISVMNGTTFVDAFVFDVSAHRSVYRVSNFKAMAFVGTQQAGTELYMGLRTSPYVAKLSTLWTPQSAYKNDADGTVVAGVWESPFFETPKFGSQRWRDAYLVYDLRDAASDGPTFTLSYCTSPEAGAAYTALSPTIGATTAKTPVRRPVRHKSRGIGFKLTRTNSAAVARVYEVGATVYGREGSRIDV